MDENLENYHDVYVNTHLTLEIYQSLLEDIDVENLEEESVGELAKKQGLDYFGFGRYGKDETITHISDKGKLKKVEPRPANDKNEDEKIQIKNVAKKLKSHAETLSKDLGATTEEIKKAFKQKDAYSFMKQIGFGFNNAATLALDTMKTFNVGLKSIFEEIHKSKILKKVEVGAIKVDEFLDKYPPLKKIGGVAVAGFLIYQWQNMAFSGDFDDDFDVSTIGAALTGSYSVKDVFSSPQGLKNLTQLTAGIVAGVTFPWGKVLPATLRLAVLYTGAKKLKNKELMEKIKAKLKKKNNEELQ